MIVVNSIGELRKAIRQRIKEQGPRCSLNDIDVSDVEDMSALFEGTDFKGDISNWNVGNVRDVTGMFFKSPLEDEVPKWCKQPNLYVRAG